MWIGFLIPVILESLASLNYLYPSVPFLPIKPSDPRLDLTPMFTTAPWNGMGYFALSFYPLVIGLTYFLPLDVAFSLWFFYLFTKFENVAATAMGYHDPGASQAMSRIPYTGEQSAGAFHRRRAFRPLRHAEAVGGDAERGVFRPEEGLRSTRSTTIRTSRCRIAPPCSAVVRGFRGAVGVRHGDRHGAGMCR